jgi:hypothetical protein
MPAILKQCLPARGRASIAKWICASIFVCLIACLFERAFVIENIQILLPSFVAIAIFLYFSLRLRSQIQNNVFGEIGFVYVAFAVAYTVFPAYGFLTLESLSSGNGLQVLALLSPDPAQLGLHLWRHVLFIVAVASGYLLFRGRQSPKFSSFDTLGDAEKPIIRYLFVGMIVSIVVLWCLSAPVNEYIDNYTRYDNLSWPVRRLVTSCSVLKIGGTFVLLTIMFRNYKRYRLYIWAFVLLRIVEEVQSSSGARIYAFMTLVAAALLYHYCVKQVTLAKGLLVTLALGLVFSAVEIARFTDINPAMEENTLEGRGMPAGELAAVFVPGFHLYAERASGTLPPVPWPVFFNDFISLIPLVDQTKWNPMYWYAENYFPDAVVPPQTMGPIALSALWGGEICLFVEGFINGMFFAFLMRWFARDGGRWRVMTIYVFCYSSCIMCLKYSIFWHLVPLEKTVLPLVLIVSVLAKDIPGRTKPARVASGDGLSRGMQGPVALGSSTGR